MVDTLQADPRMAAWPQLVSNRPSCTCLQLPAQGQPAPPRAHLHRCSWEPPQRDGWGTSTSTSRCRHELASCRSPPARIRFLWREDKALLASCGLGPLPAADREAPEREPQTPAPPLPSGAAERSSLGGGVQGLHLGVSVPGGPLPPAWGEVLGGVSGTQPCSFLGADVCCRRCWSWTRPRRHIRALTPSPRLRGQAWVRRLRSRRGPPA